MEVDEVDTNHQRRCIYINPAANLYKAPETQDNAAELEAFYSSLANYVPTELVSLPDFAAELGIKAVYVKAETFRLGLPSFKLLGASWAVRQAIVHFAKLSSSASLSDVSAAVKEYGLKLCAATDGNHGRSVAFMGRIFGVQEIKVFVPKELDERIIASIAGEGAEVVVTDGDYDHTVRTAHRFGEETEGFMLIEAVAYEGYEDVPRWAVEGYTTMLREIDTQLQLHQFQKPTMVIAPVGVGSLTQAIISYYKSPSITTSPPAIMTVEPDTAATLHKSLVASTSLSITTSPTIMAGLECGTLSSIAWPLLKHGVDISATISDWECHDAILYLEQHGVNAGPCGGAAFAGLQRLACDPAALEMLNGDSVVVCICTEGTRPYKPPAPVSGPGFSLVEALMGIHLSSSEPEIVPVSAVLNYTAQWLEYRDIDVSWTQPGSPDAALIACVPGQPGEGKDAETKSLLLISYIHASCAATPLHVFTSLAASLLALARLAILPSIPRGRVTLLITATTAEFESIIASKNPDAILLLDPSLKMMTFIPGSDINFCHSVGRSMRRAIDGYIEIAPAMPLAPVEIYGALAQSNKPSCIVGLLTGNLVDERPGMGSEAVMANALVEVVSDWCTALSLQVGG